MILVVDASVALKWFFRERPDEPDVRPATEILTAVGDGRVRMVQPPHFLAEVAAVLARETPRTGGRSLDGLRSEERRVGKECRCRCAPEH